MLKNAFQKPIFWMGVFGILLVLLIFADKKGPGKKPGPENGHDHQTADRIGFWADSILDGFGTKLPGEVVRWDNAVKAQNASAADYDSLVKAWVMEKQPLLAAVTSEKKALKFSDTKTWYETGMRFYNASRFLSPDWKGQLFQKAVASFEKALEIDPKNLDAKVQMGVCLVEGSGQPMQGITLLREVLAADSNNIDAHLNLGLFAIQSGQFDKAVERFNRILAIDPNYLEAYLYLGQTYATQGNKPKAIEALEKYKSLNKDEDINEEITKYINELKNS